VVARVKAVLRRTQGGQTLEASGLTLDEHRWRATLNGRDLGLTAVEFKLLQFLAANPGRIFGRQQLMDRIYPDERVVSERTIDSHIKKLRKKLQTADPKANLIHAVYSVGYKFENA
jgi:two-component system response regulator BaeR